MNINIENLTKLINHLTKVNERNFDMSIWSYSDVSMNEFHNQPIQKLVDNMQQGTNCGTVACIAGHAAMLSYAERGLDYNPDYNRLVLAGHAEKEARNWLGLGRGDLDDWITGKVDLAEELFCPSFRLNRTLSESIKVLEELRATAEAGDPQVKWK